MGRCIKPPAFKYDWQRDLWELEHPNWKEELREYNNEYAREHRKARTEAVAKWRLKNPERAAEQHREAQHRYYQRLKAERKAAEEYEAKQKADFEERKREAERLEKQVAVEAKENQLSGLKQNTVSSNLKKREEPIVSAKKAAESIGVSENTYRDMKLKADSI